MTFNHRRMGSYPLVALSCGALVALLGSSCSSGSATSGAGGGGGAGGAPSSSTSSTASSSTGAPGCTDTGSCDDSDKCTIDTCAQGVCSHTPVMVDDKA